MSEHARPVVFSRFELVALVAALMAFNALSIDVMLPALPNIGEAFDIPHPNDRQLVVAVYVIASGIAQLFYGPLADALGRRRVLLGALALSLAGSALCIFAPSYPMFLAGRAVQGLSGAATRVVAMALVRDLVAGASMAQIMSTAMTIFMIVPILAPGLGQLVLLAGPWRWVFAMLLMAAGAMLVWCSLRLRETLPRERRIPLSARSALAAYRQVVRHPTTLGYTLAQTLAFGAMFAYLSSAQQIFVDVFGLGPLFPLAFAGVAVTLSAAQFTNARLVMRFGMRRLSNSAALGFTVISAAHALYAHTTPHESLATFLGLLLPAMYMFAFVSANYSAIAMEPMGHVAGSAAAFAGFITTVGGAFLGGIVGRAYDGSAAPLITGHAMLGASGLVIVMITERLRPRSLRGVIAE